MRQFFQHPNGTLIDLSRMGHRCGEHLVSIDERLGDCMGAEHLAERRACGMSINECLEKVLYIRRSGGAS